MQTGNSETILCAVDFSEQSAHALREAALFSQSCNSRIVAAYANWFDAPPYFTEARLTALQNEFRESQTEAQAMLQDFVQATLPTDNGRVEARIIDALPVDGIRELASSTGARMVVMGTHGRSGWNRWTLGSVAERVLREVSIPVFTVRTAPEPRVRQILCPVNDSEASRTALVHAVRLAGCFDATVTALHVHERDGVSSIPNLCAWIPAEHRAHCTIRELVRHGDAAEEIVRLASDVPYDLIVLGAPAAVLRRHGAGDNFSAWYALRPALCSAFPDPDLPLLDRSRDHANNALFRTLRVLPRVSRRAVPERGFTDL